MGLQNQRVAMASLAAGLKYLPMIAPKPLAILALLLPGIGRLFPTSLIVTADHPVSRLSGYSKWPQRRMG